MINREFITRKELNRDIDKMLKHEAFVCDVLLGVNEEKSLLK